MPEDIKAPIGAQAPTVESAPQQPAVDPRLAEFAKREKALSNQRRQLEADRRAIEEQKKNYISPEQLKKQFLEDPTQFGLSYDDIAARYLNQPSPEDQKYRAMERKIAELEAKQGETVSKVTGAQDAALANAVKQISREVSLLVDSNEAFETIKATGSQDAVVELIKSTYDEEGILLDAEEAAKQVEDYLFEQSVMLAKLGKVQKHLQPKVEEAPQSQTAVQGKNARGTFTTTITPKDLGERKQFQTLTHSTSSRTSSNSWEEKRARMIALLQGSKA